MSLFGLLLLVLIAAISGVISQAIAGFSMGGWIVSILVGLVGAYLGWWIAITLELPPLFQVAIEGRNFPVIWSIVGGVIFVSVLSFFSGHR